jgi:hypothetical protein
MFSTPSRRSPRPLPAAIVLGVFSVFSLWVCYQDGPLGFVSLVRREPWGLQLLVDLVIASWIALSWIVRDAASRKIRAWPFVVTTTFLGSIGLLAYLVWRGWSAESVARPIGREARSRAELP